MAETNLYVNSIIFGWVTKNRKLHKILQSNDDVKSRLTRVQAITFPFVHLRASSRTFVYRSTRLEDAARFRRQFFASLATEEEKRKSVRLSCNYPKSASVARRVAYLLDARLASTITNPSHSNRYNPLVERLTRTDRRDALDVATFTSVEGRLTYYPVARVNMSLAWRIWRRVRACDISLRSR